MTITIRLTEIMYLVTYYIVIRRYLPPFMYVVDRYAKKGYPV